MFTEIHGTVAMMKIAIPANKHSGTIFVKTALIYAFTHFRDEIDCSFTHFYRKKLE